MTPHEFIAKWHAAVVGLLSLCEPEDVAAILRKTAERREADARLGFAALVRMGSIPPAVPENGS